MFNIILIILFIANFFYFYFYYSHLLLFYSLCFIVAGFLSYKLLFVTFTLFYIEVFWGLTTPINFLTTYSHYIII